jgi:RNA polymerase sigma factor (sigma-70 family)
MSALLGHAPVARPSEPAELTQYLFEKYGQRVFTFCYSRLRNREEAQDAAQTTFIYVMRSLQRGVEPEFELAWLLKIAFNVCRGVRRSTGRETAVTQEVEDIDELAAPPAADYESNERLAALRDGLAHLPESQRRGILLREWQGLSYAEIADELGLSVGAVETLLFRARHNLAGRLQHVRSGVAAINIASLAPFLRSLGRGGLGKLGLIGASASVALIPIVATEVAPALADKKSGPELRSLITPRTAPRARTTADSVERGAEERLSARRVVTAFAPLSRARRRALSAPEPIQRAPSAAPSTDSAPQTHPPPAGGSAPLPAATAVPTATVPSPTAPTQVQAPTLPAPQVQLPPVTAPPTTTDPIGILSDALAGVQSNLP